MSGRGRVTVFDVTARAGTPTAGVDRRHALALAAAALGLAGCGRSEDEIAPYAEMPERLVPGVPLRFATTLPLAGYGRGVVCISREGRPIKVEGNPRHPASQGATDVFAEAAVLGLYDPDRSRAVRGEGGRIAAWDEFLADLLRQLEGHAADRGKGLRLLTGRVTSPTLLRQIEQVRARFPGAQWHRYEAIDDDAAREGARRAFGRPLDTLPDLGRAEVVMALDADPLGPGPDQIRHGRAFAARRTVRTGGHGRAFLRLYAAEPVMSLTGANADNRLAAHPDDVGRVAAALAAELGAGLSRPELPAEAGRFVAAAGRDLEVHAGSALVLAGPGQPAEVHALAHWLNARLRAPVTHIEPIDPAPDGHGASLAALAADMAAGHVATLLVLERNPVYDAPADLGFAGALAKVPFSVHLGLYRDETATRCRWHLPASHPLEDWSDLRAPDGTASVVQPLIRPLYATRSAHELLAVIADRDLGATAHQLVRATWAERSGAVDFETWWRRALEDGLIAGTAAPSVTPPPPRLSEPRAGSCRADGGMTLVFRADASVWDGAFANNAWLQECPRPLTKEVWGNAATLAPEDAASLGLAQGDVARIEVAGGTRILDAPVLLQPGQAAGVVGLTLGHGREAAGAIGSGVGVDAYALRAGDALWVGRRASVARTGGRREVLTTQHHVRLDESRADEILPELTLASLAAGVAPPLPGADGPASLYPPYPYNGQAWGMVIDTTLCIGCNACVLACQAENNVPVVGPAEIARGRVMHWLRVDSYLQGPPGAPRPGFQPVPCMHCEQAPCEPVCPVEASVHDHEGLNVQVYNRCIGTRFCEANCPYKVRRFNFFAYNNGQEYANLGELPVPAQHNPEVTVRARGVMEKCTYCVQRISRARIAAEREGRSVADGEVVTACAAACPTQAIAFGDLNDRASAVSRLRGEPQHYALLGRLGTRPRTTYLARVRNPNAALEGNSA